MNLKLLYKQNRNVWQDWHWQLTHALRANDFGVEDLSSFPMQVTPYYAALANWDDSMDPIRMQVLPDMREVQTDGYGEDPFEEKTTAALAPGVKQRFADRILVMMQKSCSTYCRHCTRKHLLANAHVADLDQAVRCVVERPAVREVLLSGGDPLILSDAEVLRWVKRFTDLPQLDAIRIGTRTPVVLPMRFTDALVAGLAESGRVWVNTQFNHPNELTPDAIEACRKLVCAGIPVSNQSVLLKGVNDDPVVMATLCAKLQRNRIRPYYIFVCDPIAGIEHFRTTFDSARTLQRYLLDHLGGLAVPRVVVDTPNATHKKDVL